jgi:hypothetical protein
MWPTETDRPNGGWSRLDRRGRLTALVGLAALALSAAVASWFSAGAGEPSTPVYGNGGGPAAALWTWDGARYARAPIVGGGPSSNDADLAYDRGQRQIVLWDHGCSRLVMGFTGGCVQQADQTWTWDGRRWSPRSPRSEPAAVGRGAMVYDGRLGRVLYVNGVGQAWKWMGSDWVPLTMGGGPQAPRRDSALPASTFAAGYDEARNLLVYVLTSSTWSWDGTSWKEVQGGIDVADAGTDPQLVYDRAHQQLVYVGRRFTWTWDGTAWRPHDQPAISSGALAYDPVRRSVMLVREDDSACDRSACKTTTWVWDSTSWSELSLDPVPTLPLSRSGASPSPMAFDEARRVMVLFASGT